MRETTLKFRRQIFTAIFTFIAMCCAHPLVIRYPAIGIVAFIGGASAFVGMWVANFVLRE